MYHGEHTFHDVSRCIKLQPNVLSWWIHEKSWHDKVAIGWIPKRFVFNSLSLVTTAFEPAMHPSVHMYVTPHLSEWRSMIASSITVIYIWQGWHVLASTNATLESTMATAKRALLVDHIMRRSCQSKWLAAAHLVFWWWIRPVRLSNATQHYSLLTNTTNTTDYLRMDLLIHHA